MNLLVLKNFNNYFNKKVKKYSTLADYVSAASAATYIDNINFNPSDGVRTELILGKGQLGTFFDFEKTSGPDYLVCYTVDDNNTPDDSSDDVDVIESRWFIIEADRTRGGQYRLQLKRDLLADYYSPIMSASCFVEKGGINDVGNPFLYHNENMTYNQIKKSETLLKDKTSCGWVVGYIPQDAFKHNTQVSKNVLLDTNTDITVADLSAWSWYTYCSLNNARVGATTTSSTKTIALKQRTRYFTDYNLDPTMSGDYYDVPMTGDDYKYNKLMLKYTQNATNYEWDTDNNLATINYAQQLIGAYYPLYGTNGPAIAGLLTSGIRGDSTLWTNVNSYVAENLPNGVSIVSASTITSMQALDGKTIKDTSTGNIYKIKVTNLGINGQIPLDTDNDHGATILTRINNILNNAGLRQNKETMSHPCIWRYDFTADDIFVSYSGSVYSIILNQVFTEAAVEIDNNRNHVIDAPYDIFCIPYSDTAYIKYGDDASEICKCSKQLAVALAQEIAADAGSGSIYDTQLLPYCPCQELLTKIGNNIIGETGTFDIRGISSDLVKNITDTYTEVYPTNQSSLESYIELYGTIYDENYDPISFYSSSNSHYYYRDANNSAVVIGALLWCTSCMLSFDIDEEITVPSDPVERKIANETEMYRLCSGNYNGVFEFSAAKSNGVSGFRVDCTFKPINPYIHVIPKLGGLYGNFASFKDVRGLICGGDFSLAQLSNAWANYELNNKNYQNIFDRQIQNLDVNNGIALEQAKWQAGLGTVTGAVSGGTAGGLIGGGWGALAGAVVGGGASLIGGLKDIDLLKQSQAEARDYAIDQFGYQLGNIKAIPTSLSKNSSLNPNLKIFPFVEYYGCTVEEQNALAQKIRFSGMTIGAVGSLSVYNNDLGCDRCYLQGQIIDLDSITDDAHVANAIYDEVKRGFYILYYNY